MPFTLHYIVKKFASETLVNTTILKKCEKKLLKSLVGCK